MTEEDDIRLMLARIERSQADMAHEFQRLRADLAILASRQNSAIADTKKKPVELRTLSMVWPSAC